MTTRHPPRNVGTGSHVRFVLFLSLRTSRSGRPATVSAFDHTKWTKAGYFASQTGIVDDAYYFVNVLVRLRDLFQNSVARFAAHQNALFFQLLLYLSRIPPLFGSGAAHQPARAIADAPKGLPH